MEVSPLINNFNGGELSPRLDVRSDVNKYYSGCRTLENMMPLIEGGATRVPGTYYAGAVKDSTKGTRLVPFHFSTIQAYAIEFGEHYIRFWKDGGQIVVDYAAWVTGTAYVLGNLVTSGTGYYRCIVAHTAAAAFATDLTAGKWVASGGATDLAYEIVSTYDEDELFDLKFVQSADYLYIVHPDHAPATLTRSAHTAWTLAAMSLTASPFTPPVFPGAIAFFEQRLIFGGTTSEPQTIWASVSGDYDNFTVTADEDDSSFEYTIVSDRVDKIQWLIGVDVLLVGTIGGVWKVSSSNISDPITPTNVSVKKQVTIGAKNIDPEAVADSVLWVSRAGTSIRQSSYDYASDKWRSPDMTRVSKHITRGDTAALSGIIDVDFQAEPQPILWAVRADGQLLGMTYETQEEIYAWFRVTTDGLFECVAVTSAEDEEDVVWVIVNRTLNGATVRCVEYFTPVNFYNVLEDCFFVHCGLSYDGGDAVDITGISKANPAVVTAANDFTDGQEVRITGVEGMTQVNQGKLKAYTVANRTAANFELSGIDSSGWGTYTSGGTAQVVTNTPSGLDHLNGEEVAVLIDGAPHPNVDVAAGTTTLNYYGNKIHIGLPCTAILEPSKLAIPLQIGTTRGKMQRISKMVVAFDQTVGVKWGPDQDNLSVIPFGTGVQPAFFSGDKEAEFLDDWSTAATISIVQDQPLPMTVLAIIPELVSYET